MSLDFEFDITNKGCVREDWSNDRTGCSERDKFVSYTCTTPLCEHRSQLAYDVKFWVFKKRIWICEDCEAVLDAKGKVIG